MAAPNRIEHAKPKEATHRQRFYRPSTTVQAKVRSGLWLLKIHRARPGLATTGGGIMPTTLMSGGATKRSRQMQTSPSHRQNELNSPPHEALHLPNTRRQKRKPNAKDKGTSRIETSLHAAWRSASRRSRKRWWRRDPAQGMGRLRDGERWRTMWLPDRRRCQTCACAVGRTTW